MEHRLGLATRTQISVCKEDVTDDAVMLTKGRRTDVTDDEVVLTEDGHH